MDAKWLFMLITITLLFFLGLVIANIEKTAVINNWKDRRCEIPIMMMASFFKPDDDSRTNSDFSKDNFDFCMKSFVDRFMEAFMNPINKLFGKQTNAADGAIGTLNSVKQIASNLYETFSTYVNQFFRRFSTSVFELSRIIQYLRMAMNRMSAVVMNMIYTGITLFRGMINSIQFVIKVILIICGIMIAILIILWFVLFPVIPFILTTLSAVVATVLALGSVMSSSLANEAESKKGGFCFATSTKILLKDKNGNNYTEFVENIKLGDELANNCGIVTAIIVMNGNDVELYEYNGIMVSGSHLVKGEDNTWKDVESDNRFKKTSCKSSNVYCFNTTSNNIPVSGNNNIVIFRDWEEICNDDNESQYLWNYLILKMLNEDKNYEIWKDGIKMYTEVPLIGKNVYVKVIDGYIEINKLKLGDKVIDRNGKEQEVIGIINAEVKDTENDNTGKWKTELYELNNNIWIKGKKTVKPGNKCIEGMMIITEKGELIIWDDEEEKEKIVRDFTEVGYKSIHKTYDFVATRLPDYRTE
jgi:hypothetical protein